ncbi:MAG: baseplate J/gp47 family protein [Zoogloeaceae bacterium]|jgi:hypothetical protein|nr:baseplate J/gp47 family protein [Zoogloeaceae bacterium]
MAYDFIVRTGVIVPDTADARAAVEQEFRDAFGRQDLITTPDTPQGVLITQEVIARQNVARNNADLANQINPNLATGLFLDALCALTGLTRKKATRTRARAVALTGVPNTILPQGARARTEAGDIFVLTTAVALDTNGNGEGDFEAEQFGAVGCPANTLNAIIDVVLGWETVNNPNAGTLGEEEQTDASLAALRNRTLARQGISTVEAQISGLYEIPGVKSLAYRENIFSTTETIDGIEMLPHSVWACVDGGADATIAASLLNNKTDGAAWNGAVEVEIIEPWSGQAYTVRFDRPTEVPILARVTVRNILNSVQDPQTVIRQA